MGTFTDRGPVDRRRPRRSTCPVLFLLQTDDELVPLEGGVALFRALGSPDRRLHAHPGRHSAVPIEEMEASEAFFAACTVSVDAARFLTPRQEASSHAHHEHDPRRRHRRGRDGQPAGERPHRGGWFELADLAHRARARRRACGSSCCAPRAAGFNAGVDIKEMQATEGFDALIGANRGLLRRLRRRVRVPGAGDRRGATATASAAGSGWSATPTSSSPPTTPPSACPRSTAARSAPPPT